MSSSSDGRDFKTDITADPSQFEAGMKKATKAAVDASDNINAQFKKVGDTFSMVTKYFAGFTAVIAGGGALKKFISDANEWNSEAGKMSKLLGITTEKASVLNVALNHLGLGSDVFITASEKISKQVQSNAQAFDVLGVKTRDASGAYKPVTELMGEVNQKLIEIKNPIEQNIAGQQVYGRGWSEIRGILRLTSDEMANADKRARQLGLIVGPEGVAQSKQYSAQMRDLGLIGKSLEVQFGNALLPVFTRTGKFLGEEGPAMGKVFALVLESIIFGASAVWLALKDMGDGIGAIAAQAAALLSGDLEGFRAIGRMRDEEAKKNEQAYEKLKADFGKPLPAAATSGAPDLNKGPKYRFKEKGEAAESAASSRMGDWEAQLAEKKAALTRSGLLEDQYREMSKAEELGYWNDIKAWRGLSENEKLSVTRKSAEVEMSMIRETFEVRVATLQAEAAAYKNNTDERMRIELEIQSKYAQGTKEYEASQKKIVEIQRQAADQERTIRESRVQAERDARLATITLEEQAAQQAEQLGAITQQQLLAHQLAFEERRNEIAFQALYQRLQDAELDPDRNPVELEKIHAQIEQLEHQHQQRMGQIKGAMHLDDMAPLVNVFKGAETAISGAIQGIINRTMSLRQALASIWKGISQTVITEISNMLAKKVVAWATERTLATASIGAKAADAGAGAAASQSSIPYVGPILAIAAMAAVFAGVMAMKSNVPSAAGGFDIPATMNPLTQLHKSEMVLPAKYADVIRAQADNGGSSQAPAPMNVHIHSPDAEGVRRLLLNNPAALAEALLNARRNNYFTGEKR